MEHGTCYMLLPMSWDTNLQIRLHLLEYGPLLIQILAYWTSSILAQHISSYLTIVSCLSNLF